MKHAGPGSLARLEPLLTQVRALGQLREMKPGLFYAGGRAVLHFHEDPTGLYADVKPPGAPEFKRLEVQGEEGRSTLIAILTRRAS